MAKKKFSIPFYLRALTAPLTKHLYLAVFLAIPLSALHAQTYPDSIRIPVTFYDFHSNLSNPEFETVPSSTPAIWPNMVDSQLVIGLDGKPKPVLGSHPFFNLDIKKWFVKWTAGDSMVPSYGTPQYPVANAAGLTPQFILATTDTAFTNKVIEDTLTFRQVTPGVYQFVSNSFFPLDNKGFGNEGSNHNFSYTMELHTQIQMTPGLTFSFSGDDDVWAFINNKLAMDLGGRHSPQNGTINVDNIPGLVAGKKYNFDFFYCERHSPGATIKITTNLFTPPTNVKVFHVTPPNYSDITHPLTVLDTAHAGTPYTLTAHLFDSTGTIRPEYDTMISWTMVDTLGSLLTKKSGDSTTLLATKAFGTVTITATFKNSNDPNSPTFVKTIQLYIAPGKPHHLDILRTPVVVDIRVDDPLQSITLEETVAQTSVYAIVRDSLGNFIDSARNASWASSDPTLGTVGAGSVVWQGTIIKLGGGTIKVTVSSPGLVDASIDVILKVKAIPPPPRPYKLDLDTAFIYNPLVDKILDSIVLDDKTISIKLYAVVRDSLNKFLSYATNAQWNSSDLSTGTITVDPNNIWQATITKIKAGSIIITVTSNGLIQATVKIIFKVRQIPGEIISAPANNPASPNRPIAPKTLTFYRNVIDAANASNSNSSGALIGIISKKPLISTGTIGSHRSYGKVAVYDALGNAVSTELYVFGTNENVVTWVVADSTKRYAYGIYWDCHNQDHRWVGSGTYLLVGSITDIENTSKIVKEKIGFSRQ